MFLPSWHDLWVLHDMAFITLNSCNQKGGGTRIFTVRGRNPVPSCYWKLGSSLFILTFSISWFVIINVQKCYLKVNSLKMIRVCPITITILTLFFITVGHLTAIFMKKKKKSSVFCPLMKKRYIHRSDFDIHTATKSFLSGAIALTHPPIQ